ncbi:MAG: hypothetical protein ACRCU2_18565 [Planktothrix sp.]
MKEHSRKIKISLEQLTEDLLALSDEIWQSIDHNDPEALEAGYLLKREYNQKVDTFNEMAQNIGSILQKLEELTALNDFEKPELEHDTQSAKPVKFPDSPPHRLDEDFCYKRPRAMEIENQLYTGLNTWKAIYIETIKYLAKKDYDTFQTLPESNFALGRRKGNVYVGRQPEKMRIPEEFVQGFFFETNLSANNIRENLKKILNHFNIPHEAIIFYWREDKDADYT